MFHQLTIHSITVVVVMFTPPVVDSPLGTPGESLRPCAYPEPEYVHIPDIFVYIVLYTFHILDAECRRMNLN